jgi:hypothetical protein
MNPCPAFIYMLQGEAIRKGVDAGWGIDRDATGAPESAAALSL